ncbi:hypothetical protein H0H93_015009, partial [Arthromyces matolae]
MSSEQTKHFLELLERTNILRLADNEDEDTTGSSLSKTGEPEKLRDLYTSENIGNDAISNRLPPSTQVPTF